MANGSSEKRCRIIPPGDLRCVWMEVGVLVYQLCERQYDCDNCPLDAALRAHFRRGLPEEKTGDKAPERSTAAQEPLAGDRRYSRGHCWVRPAERGTAAGTPQWRVGLEPHLAAALLRPRSIVLPAVGESVRRGQMHLWIVAEGGTFALAAPIDGTVRSANGRLAEQPSLLTSSPLADGWLYDIAATRATPQWASLMDSPNAERCFAARTRRFQAVLSQALSLRHLSVGPTLPDGGAPLGDVSQMIGP